MNDSKTTTSDDLVFPVTPVISLWYFVPGNLAWEKA